MLFLMLYIKIKRRKSKLIVTNKRIKNMKYQVYVHTFPNNKKYVGLSTMENINQRWQNGYGYKTQKLMYRAILKWGWKNIKHKIYEVETELEMKYLEKYLIAYYQTTNPKYGYNISTGGEYGSGVPSARRKAIDQYDKQGHFIRTWESITAIDKTLNYNFRNISKCVTKRCPTAYNFYWCYSGQTPEFKTCQTIRKVYQYDLEGNKIAEYKNASEAGRSIGKGRSTIIKCCNKKLKSCYGYI